MTIIGPLTVHEFLFLVKAGGGVPAMLRDSLGMEEKDIEDSVAAGALFVAVRTDGGADLAAIAHLDTTIARVSSVLRNCSAIYRVGAKPTSDNSCRLIMDDGEDAWELITSVDGMCLLRNSPENAGSALDAWVDDFSDSTCLVTAFTTSHQPRTIGISNGITANWQSATGWSRTDERAMLEMAALNTRIHPSKAALSDHAGTTS